jgi:hypothetical protein
VHRLLVLLAACAAAPVAPPVQAPPPAPVQPTEPLAEPNRPLTVGEIALLTPIFRDGIDYAGVRVINNSFPLQPANVYMTPRGHVYAPGDLWSTDFSAQRTATFVHEMTHVWQFANGMDLIGQGFLIFTRFNGRYEMAYPYELVAGRDLVDYGMEQQASIVEDYFLIQNHGHPQELTNTGLSDADRDRLYADVMKNFLQSPRYARGLDAHDIAERHANASLPPTIGTSTPGHMCAWRFTPPK